nr:unnamed protein product [Spirometra erinaceieuropaei]
MLFQSRVSTTTVHELLFADDCALNITSEENMQRSMDLFSTACENFGLVISTVKTVPLRRQLTLTGLPIQHFHPPPPLLLLLLLILILILLLLLRHLLLLLFLLLLILLRCPNVCRRGAYHAHQHYTPFYRTDKHQHHHHRHYW